MPPLHLTLLASFSLLSASCVAGRGEGWAAIALGTDAERLSMGPQGVEVSQLNQSRGLDMARRQLRNAALIGAAPGLLRELGAAAKTLAQ